MDDPNQPTLNGIPLPLFLDILWGYRDRTDRRDKAVPPAAITQLLAALPPEVQRRYFHIQQSGDGALPVVWQIDEWTRSGHPEAMLRAKCNSENYKADTLTEWLIKNVPFWAGQDRAFVRNFVSIMIRDDTYSMLANFGLTEEQINNIKTGSY